MLAKMFASKINWTQYVAGAAMLLAWFGIDVPEEQKAAIVATIGGVQTVLTWVLRTFFNKPQP